MNPLNPASVQNLKDLSGMTKLAKQQAIGQEQSEAADLYTQAKGAGLLFSSADQLEQKSVAGPAADERTVTESAPPPEAEGILGHSQSLNRDQEDRLRLLDSSIHSKLQLNSDLSPEQLSAAQKMVMVDVTPAKISKTAQLKHSHETDAAMKPVLSSAGPAGMMEIVSADASRPNILESIEV